MTNVAHIPGSFFLGAPLSAANEADWIESRVRTMSRGYVKKTDVIPASPPHTRRLAEVKSAPGVASKNCTMTQSVLVIHITDAGIVTHLFIEVIATELDSRVRHYSYAVRTIASHEAFPPLFFPDFD
jgi:hypothetical protein